MIIFKSKKQDHEVELTQEQVIDKVKTLFDSNRPFIPTSRGRASSYAYTVYNAVAHLSNPHDETAYGRTMMKGYQSVLDELSAVTNIPVDELFTTLGGQEHTQNIDDQIKAAVDNFLEEQQGQLVAYLSHPHEQRLYGNPLMGKIWGQIAGQYHFTTPSTVTVA